MSTLARDRQLKQQSTSSEVGKHFAPKLIVKPQSISVIVAKPSFIAAYGIVAHVSFDGVRCLGLVGLAIQILLITLFLSTVSKESTKKFFLRQQLVVMWVAVLWL